MNERREHSLSILGFDAGASGTIGKRHFRASILTNEFFVDVGRLALSDRESELLAILALRGGYMDAEAIAAAMWSDVDIVESLKALRVYISRVRKILPHPSLIKSEKNGYRLDATISTDLWEIDAALREQRGRDLDTVDVGDLEALFRRLQDFYETQRVRSIRWSWFPAVELQIDSYRREIGLCLGHRLLALGRVYEAHRIGQQLVASDQLCELSRELSIKVQLALENYTVAVRQYRSFESVLREELRAQPSQRLRHLLASYLLA